MTITICGSMAFSEDMVSIKNQLSQRGFQVIIPEGAEDYVTDPYLKAKAAGWGTVEGADRKIKMDLIRKHYNEIVKSDAILVVNKDKNGIANYIGGNSFLEMGFAYILNKPIYLLQPIPSELPIFHQELVAMQPIILNGDVTQIGATNDTKTL